MGVYCVGQSFATPPVSRVPDERPSSFVAGSVAGGHSVFSSPAMTPHLKC